MLLRVFLVLGSVLFKNYGWLFWARILMNFCVRSFSGKSDWNLNGDTHHVSHKGALKFIKFFRNKGNRNRNFVPFQ